MSKIRLLLGITLSDLGGAQRIVQEIIENLPDDRYEITLVTAAGGPLVEWGRMHFQTTKLEVVEMASSHREVSPINDIRLFFSIIDLIRRRNIDIAHFHSSKMGFIGRLAAHVNRGCRIIYTAHGWGAMNKYQCPLLRIAFGTAEKIAAICSDRVVCVAEADRKLGEINGWVPIGRGVTIINGLPDTSSYQRSGILRRELNIDNSIPIIGTVARMAQQKAPEFIVHIAANFARAGRKFALVMVGDGPLFSATQKLVEDLGLHGIVHLLGPRIDVAKILPDFDVFTLFSRWEGLPLSIIEAMFAGLPVIATDVGGVRELVQNEVTGLVVPPMDEEAAISGLERLLDDPVLRQRLGNSGRAFAKEHLTVQKMVEQYDRLYNSLLSTDVSAII